MLKFVFFILGFILFHNAHAAVVATIGDKSIVIDKSTSCTSKSWALNQTYACGCCITKEKMTTLKPADDVLRTCIKGNQCTLPTLNQWVPGETNPEEIIANILWNTIDSPNVPVDPKLLNKSGQFQPGQFINFLASLKRDLRDLREPMLSDFSMPQCLKVDSLKANGVNVLQLFIISVNEKCFQGRADKTAFIPKYVVKDTKKKTTEIRNLRQLHNSDLKKLYDIQIRNRSKDKLAISFDLLNIKYKFQNTNHYLSILSAAQGMSLMDVSKNLALSIKKGDTTAIHRDSDILYNSFLSLGKGIGELHRYFMDKPTDKRLLGNSMVHGDLHLENVFVDPLNNFLITLIDNESFSKSLVKKRPVGVDLFVLYAFTVSQFKGKYSYPKEISATLWNNLMLKPFLLGYISLWPQSQRAQLLNELRNIYTNPATQLTLLPQRSLFINPISYLSKLKDVKRVFDEISINYKENTHVY